MLTFTLSFLPRSRLHYKFPTNALKPPTSYTRSILTHPPNIRATLQTKMSSAAFRPSRPYKSAVETSRVHFQNAHPITKTSGSFVLYWMQTSVRTQHNPALEEAAALSSYLSKPLRVAYLLDILAQDAQPLGERHVSFLLDGLQDVATALKDRNVMFAPVYYTTDIPQTLADLAKDAAVVVTDTSYLRPGIAVRKKTAQLVNVPFLSVEADIVVPVETASNKAEHAARTIRPKITRIMDDFLVHLEQMPLSSQQDEHQDVENWINQASGDLEIIDLTDSENVLQNIDGLDRGAVKVETFKGGQVRAQEILKQFLDERLLEYGNGRNEPVKQLQSDLSPYLRAGNISPVDITLQTKEHVRKRGRKGALKESEDSFLEELIVRRELAVNACWFNAGTYDIYEEIVPNFAKESLELHKSDERSKIYTYEELEAGVTNDPFWNAAQLEMIVRGKQHGYMRMYWVKQIIGWVAEPEKAMNIALRLNNRWELDAVDPNSYAGVIWCFGLHDQGWKERPIWGKVRYMNESGLKRKFNMSAYLALVDRMVAQYGLPKHIETLRKERGFNAVQKTITQSLKRGRSGSSNTGKKKLPKKIPASSKSNTGKSSKNSAAKSALLNSIKRLET